MPRMASSDMVNGVRQPQERVEEVLVAPGPLERRAGGRGGHGDVDVAVAGHRLGRRVPRVVRPGEPDEEEEGLGPVVLLEPAHGLGPVPGVDVGREGQGHRGGVPHGHALGGVAPVLVLPLVAAVGDVRAVGVEQARGRPGSRCSATGILLMNLSPVSKTSAKPSASRRGAMSSMWPTVRFSSR